MTLRTTVLPLGFGLSAILCVSTAPADDAPASPPRLPARVYTNADLDRVRPFRDQTGVRSVPAVAPDPPVPSTAGRARERPAPSPVDARGRGGLLAAGEPSASGTGCGRWRPRRPSCAHGSPSAPRKRAASSPAAGRGSSGAGSAAIAAGPARGTRAPHAADGGRPGRAAPAAQGALPRLAAVGEAGAMLRFHAGDPGRARAAPLHGLGGPRALTTAAGAARGPPREEDPPRGQPPRRRAPRPRRGALAARLSARCTWPSSPTASASRAVARWRRSTTPSSRPASAATGSWSPSGAGSWAISRASPPPRGCAAWTGWASRPRSSPWWTARSAARWGSTTRRPRT